MLRRRRAFTPVQSTGPGFTSGSALAAPDSGCVSWCRRGRWRRISRHSALPANPRRLPACRRKALDCWTPYDAAISGGLSRTVAAVETPANSHCQCGTAPDTGCRSCCEAGASCAGYEGSRRAALLGFPRRLSAARRMALVGRTQGTMAWPNGRRGETLRPPHRAAGSSPGGGCRRTPTTRGGRCFKYRPGGRYFIYRPPPECF